MDIKLNRNEVIGLSLIRGEKITREDLKYLSKYCCVVHVDGMSPSARKAQITWKFRNGYKLADLSEFELKFIESHPLYRKQIVKEFGDEVLA